MCCRLPGLASRKPRSSQKESSNRREAAASLQMSGISVSTSGLDSLSSASSDDSSSRRLERNLAKAPSRSGTVSTFLAVRSEERPQIRDVPPELVPETSVLRGHQPTREVGEAFAAGAGHVGHLVLYVRRVGARQPEAHAGLHGEVQGPDPRYGVPAVPLGVGQGVGEPGPGGSLAAVDRAREAEDESLGAPVRVRDGGRHGQPAVQPSQQSPLLGADPAGLERQQLPCGRPVEQEAVQQERPHVARRPARQSRVLRDANPQAFIEIAGEVINRTKRLAIVDGIKYQRIGDEHYYAQELFAQEELTGYLRNMLKDAQKSVFEHVIYDSGGVERTFAEELEKNEAVKIYAKLPGWFKVPTPLGTYNPDWAVLVEVDGDERFYFVVETKGSLFVDDLRDNEAAKIACGEAHFNALAVGKNPARYIKARNVDDLMDRL